MTFMSAFTVSYNSSDMKHQDRTQIMTKKGDKDSDNSGGGGGGEQTPQ